MILIELYFIKVIKMKKELFLFGLKVIFSIQVVLLLKMLIMLPIQVLIQLINGLLIL